MPGTHKLNANEQVVIIYNDGRAIITVDAYVYSVYETRNDNMYVFDTELADDPKKTPYSFACSVAESAINKSLSTEDLPSVDDLTSAWNVNDEFKPDVLFVYESDYRELIVETQKILQNHINNALLNY